MLIPAKIIKDTKYIPTSLSSVHQSVAKKLFKVNNKLKKNLEKKNLNNEIYKWFLSLKTDEKIKVCSIHNKWLIQMIYQMMVIQEYEPGIKFIPTDLIKDFKKDDNKIQNNLNNFEVNYSNNLELYETYFKPSPSREEKNSFRPYENYNSKHKEEKDNEKKFMKEIRFLTLNEINDTITISVELFNQPASLIDFFSVFSAKKGMTSTITSYQDTETNLYLFELPEWTKNIKSFSLCQLLVIFFEQVICINYQFYLNDKKVTGLFEEYEKLKDIFDITLKIENFLIEEVKGNKEDFFNKIDFDSIKESLKEDKVKAIANYYKEKKALVHDSYYKESQYPCVDYDDDVLIKNSIEELRSVFFLSLPKFVNMLTFIEYKIVFKAGNFVYNKLFEMLTEMYSKKTASELIMELNEEDKDKKKDKKKKRGKKKKREENSSKQNKEENISNELQKEFPKITKEQNKEIDSEEVKHLSSEEKANNYNLEEQEKKSEEPKEESHSSKKLKKKKEKRPFLYPLKLDKKSPSSTRKNNSPIVSNSNSPTNIKGDKSSSEQATDLTFSSSKNTETTKENKLQVSSSSSNLSPTGSPINSSNAKSSVNDNLKEENNLNINYYPHQKQIYSQRMPYFCLGTYNPLFALNEQYTAFFGKISSEVKEFSKMISNNLSLIEEYRKKIIYSLQNRIKNFLSQEYDIELILYGSYATGLSIESSDVDILIKFKEKNKDKSSNLTDARHIIIEKLVQFFLSKKTEFPLENVNPIYTASVPVIKMQYDISSIIPEKVKEKIMKGYKFDYVNDISKIKFDLTFFSADNAEIPSQAIIEFIKEKLSIYQCIRPIMMVLKRYMQLWKLNSSFSGGISSFSMFLLLLAYIKSTYSNKDDVGRIIFEFFGCYANFNFRSFSIDVTANK